MLPAARGLGEAREKAREALERLVEALQREVQSVRNFGVWHSDSCPVSIHCISSSRSRLGIFASELA